MCRCCDIPYKHKTVAGENFGEFDESGAIHQALSIQVYIMKLQVDSMTNENQANDKHAWMKIINYS